MKPFAVVRVKGKQYMVEKDDTIVVDHIAGEVGSEITLDEVLLFAKSTEDVEVGTPLIKKAAVKAKIIEQGKGEKIRVSRFRAKTHYRKTRGFRSILTSLQIMSLTA